MNWPLLILAAVLVAVSAIAAFGPSLATVSGWFKGSTPDTADDDAADVAALKRLQARFKRLNCPEGTEAMKVAGSHFFHEGAVNG